MILGITGGTGCGKTTLLDCIRERGGLVLDCDAIYHRLLAEDAAMQKAIADRFPEALVDGSIHRKTLGTLVFSDPQALLDLNRITHAAVKTEVLRCLQDFPGNLAAIDAIALFESGLSELCDWTVAVTAPEEIRVQRLMVRDRISMEYAISRIRAQKNPEFFKSHCDFTLENNGSLRDFQARSRKLLSSLREKHDAASCKMIRRNFSMSNEKLRETLMFKPKHGYDQMTETQRAEMEAYCREYAKFMNAAKMEREAVTFAAAAAEKAGFHAFVPGEALKPGDKVYHNNRGKSMILAVIGEESLENGAHIAAAHIDSPRMDLKPHPLYEDSEIAYLKTHYYGGIKKYQWTTIPLALHGVVYRRDGSLVNITIGEDENDPIFCISDLLVHLSADQMKKTLAEGIAGEQLNLIVGSIPTKDDDGSDRVKLAVLQLLNEKYGITEEDFISAELNVVPAGKCREIGLDRSLLGAYGHDDRVCAFAALDPILKLGTPKKTAVCVLADKEEIGSVGISGMQSQVFECFMQDLCNAEGANLYHCFQNSFCLSTDVTNAFDPNFPETCERNNTSFLNYGIGIAKYTGSRGKGGCSDASAEAMSYVRDLFARNGVAWQTAELGKVDQGGGGTVAAYMANRNIVTVDAGVPVLCMHAPMEVVAKYDCYMTMKAMDALYRD